MRFTLPRGPLFIAAALVASSCSFRFEESAALPPEIVVPGDGATLSFENKGTIAMAPGETRTITVRAKPPANYEVSFALLGGALDASLDKSKETTGADGTASVKLKAPNSATTFRLRASIRDGASAEVPIAVSDKGFGTIRAVPVYAGTREVTEWVASAVTGTNCKAIAELLPKNLEAALNAKAPADKVPTLKSVPVGPNVAVVLRAGFSMWGCTDEPNLKAGETRDVEVTVIEKPIDLSATEMDVTFDLKAAPEPYSDVMKSAAALLSEAFLPGPDATAAALLLDAMHDAAPPDSADAFADERAMKGWDGLVKLRLASLLTTPSTQIEAWLAAELKPEGDPPTVGSQIVGNLTAVGDAAGHALLKVSKLGAIDAQAAGIPGFHLVSWTADASDSVMLGGTIFWMPSRYVGALVLEGAKKDMPGVTKMSEALSEVIGCADIGMDLGGFAMCDAACVTALCESALDARWQKGLDASAESGLAGEITISASTPAKVDDNAAPLSFEGKWLGTLSDSKTAVTIGGTVVGATPAKPEPPQP